MNGHHLIMGQLSDYLTGDALPDTHDERYRQKLSRWLVERKGFAKSDLLARRALVVTAGDKQAELKVDLAVQLGAEIHMVLSYSPGSIVTRHRPVLAISRLLAPYQIPLAVATNGEDADVLEGVSGRVIASGLEGIPSKTQLLSADMPPPEPITARRAALEARILYAYEIDDRCPCDDTVCRI